MNFIKTKEEHHFCIGRFSNLWGQNPMLGNMKKNPLLYYLHSKVFLWEKEI